LLNPNEEDPTVPLTYVQSERRLREEAVNAFKSFGGEGEEDEDEDDVLEVKGGGKLVEGGGEAGDEYRKFMLEMGGGEEEVRKVLGIVTNEAVSNGEDESSDEEERIVKLETKPAKKAKKGEVTGVKKARKAKADDDFLMKWVITLISV
jgi:protein KRI1